MVTATAVALLIGMPADPAHAARGARAPWDGLFSHLEPRARPKTRQASVPLPKPRPAEAPSAEPEEPPEQEHSTGKDRQQNKEKDQEQAAPAQAPAPQPSACRLALTETIAIAPSIPDIHGAGGCGGEDLVRLEAVVLPDQRRVPVKPAAILRCPMASALAAWIRSDIAPLAERQGSTVAELDNFDSFECRGRNRVVGAKLSEHGRANALDVRAFKLANGRSISLTDRTVAREVRESVLQSACARFSTVLGPGSDGYHEDHIHLDLIERRNNYRICQWDVWDPMPQRPPLLPAERPEEAPPREVAAKSDDAKPAAGKHEAEPEAKNAEKDEAEPLREEKPAKKKRRQDRRS
ncbi:MAG: extensin family protein [Bradyrhizobium sp.]